MFTGKHRYESQKSDGLQPPRDGNNAGAASFFHRDFNAGSPPSGEVVRVTQSATLTGGEQCSE